MKNRKILLLFCYLLTGSVRLLAQDRFPHDNLSSSFIPSVNAGNSAYSTSITVDPYTGMLQAGFTLYSYKNASTGLSHSITIGYNGGGGVHVDDIASNVGLEWSLNTGGIITRSINDLADEFGVAVDTENDLGVVSQYLTQTQDGRIDNYFYNAGGVSGKFVVGHNSQIYSIPANNVTIQRSINGYSPSSAPLDSCYSISFTITLTNGTKYIFANFDCSQLNYFDSASVHKKYATSTWYLSKIISAFNRDTIYFDYSPAVQSYYVGTSNSEYIYNSGTISSPNYLYYQHSVDYNNRSRDMRLNDIKYPDGTQVTFNYSSFNRLDLHTDNAIDNITITNGSSSYGYKFNYQYTYYGNTKYSYQDYSSAPEWSDPQQAFRLMLTGFNLFSGSNALPGYSFQYDSSYFPARGTASNVDHWGFYSTNARGKLPQVLTTSIDFNRNPTFNTCAVLQKISLPTGGNVQLQYEQNTTKTTLPSPAVASYIGTTPYFPVGGVRVKQLIESDNTGQANNLVHEYNYMESDGVTYSGVVATVPVYNFNYTENYQPASGDPIHPSPAYAFSNNPDLVSHYVNSSAVSGTNYTYQVYTDAAVNSQIFTHGSPVGYDRVTEFLGSSTNFKKKTVYEFTVPTSSPLYTKLFSTNLPFLDQPDLDYATGLPITISEYNNGGKLLSKTVNTYNTYTQNIQDLNFVEMKVGSLVYPPVDMTSYKKVVYYPLTGKVVPAQTTTTKYYANGDSISNVAQFTYDTSKMVLRQSLGTDSKGTPVVTKYYYPYDFSISGPIATLQSTGIIYDPVRVEVWKDTISPKLMNSNVVTFQSLSDGSIKPLSAYTFTTTTPVASGTFGSFNNTQLLQNPQYFTRQGTLDVYDNKGDLLQTSQNGVPTSFIWAYKNKYPVAKVANAAVSDIAYTSFEEGTGNWTPPGGLSSSSAFISSAVTGNYVYSLYSGNTLSKSGLNTAKTYILSYWSQVSPPSVSYNNGGSPISVSPVASDKHNGWTLYKTEISGASTVTLTGTLTGGISAATIDELRLYPKGSFMTTSSFDPLFGITSSCDAANRVTYYEYDVFGRLKYQRNFDRNITKAYDYKNQEAQ